MVNSPQYNYNPYPYQYPQQSQAYKPKTSVDSVKIDIINPKASMEPAYPGSLQGSIPGGYYPPGYYQPYYPVNNNQNINNNPYYNTVTNNTVTRQPAPQQQPQPQPAPQPQPQPAPQPQPQQPQPPQNQQPQPPQNQQPQNQQPQTQPPQQPQATANIPDSLIKAIDQGLSSPNPDIRINAATKLLQTFEKNPGAANHPALTVLLNRVLKDPHQNIRLMGEIMLNTGVAKGDIETKNILNGMTNSTKAFGQDAVAASNILMNMAAEPQQVAQPNPAPQPGEPQAPQVTAQNVNQQEIPGQQPVQNQTPLNVLA